jgi:hypothetical protein
VQTPLYVTFRKRVTDAIERLVKTQVVPWSFFTSGTPLRIKTFDGREIRFQGVKFDGSPRRIFWARYIEPFLEDLSVSEIAAAVSMARERQVDAPLLLQELRVLLAAGFRTVYRRMVDVDRRLRGGGFPETVEARSVKGELQAMTDFLDEWIQSEIAMCQSASSETRSKPEVGVWLWHPLGDRSRRTSAIFQTASETFAPIGAISRKSRITGGSPVCPLSLIRAMHSIHRYFRGQLGQLRSFFPVRLKLRRR